MTRVKRFPHKIGRIRRAAFPEYVIFWDVETFVDLDNPETEHRFRLGWACVRRERKGKRPTYNWHPLRAPSDLWSLLDSVGRRRCRIWMVAHNISFDFYMCGGFPALFRAGYSLQSVYNRGPVTLVTAKRGERRLMLVDSLNIFTGALASWGEEIGLPKLDTDTQDPDDEKVSVYCRRDVEILVRLYDEWIDLLREHDLGGPSVTIGGQAMRTYRYRYMDHPIHIHAVDDVVALERWAYFGGRTECWYVGRLPPGEYAMLDVNSLYPYVMRTYEYPCRFLWHTRKGCVEDIRKGCREGAVVARVRVETDRPVVPYRWPYRTVFPVGRFWTTLTTPELEVVMETGRILDVTEVAVYETAPLFRRYVDDLYRLRLRIRRDGRPLQERMIKRLLNSLYGKWGQKAERWESCENVEGFANGRTVWSFSGSRDLHPALVMGSVVWYMRERGESRHSFPAIAAHVTAWGRRTLWEYMETAGLDHVYYCDTDSLLVDSIGRRRLADDIDPDRLGALKVETEADGGEIRSLKDYTFGDKHKTKGLTRNAVELDEGLYRDLHWPKLMGMLEQGRLAGYQNRIVYKRLNRKYDKGTVTSSGRVVPLEFDEWSLDGDECPF